METIRRITAALRGRQVLGLFLLFTSGFVIGALVYAGVGPAVEVVPGEIQAIMLIVVGTILSALLVVFGSTISADATRDSAARNADEARATDTLRAAAELLRLSLANKRRIKMHAAAKLSKMAQEWPALDLEQHLDEQGLQLSLIAHQSNTATAGVSLCEATRKLYEFAKGTFTEEDFALAEAEYETSVAKFTTPFARTSAEMSADPNRRVGLPLLLAGSADRAVAPRS
jgi:hypothetical protein